MDIKNEIATARRDAADMIAAGMFPVYIVVDEDGEDVAIYATSGQSMKGIPSFAAASADGWPEVVRIEGDAGRAVAHLVN
ncbi:hypothetical protein [Azospirillum sp. TSO5]|uniref:hypothetical protein n=1 Tax=Azospirillum sp. TSO5 TaxID=716760 RepID=UPI000D61DC78|nr:hypothetical protein [Azospirillum sp. TSO5]PWC92969.1 hypothetical protein TSO5_16210 [Azospirillum sp. TSO5]